MQNIKFRIKLVIIMAIAAILLLGYAMLSSGLRGGHSFFANKSGDFAPAVPTQTATEENEYKNEQSSQELFVRTVEHKAQGAYNILKADVALGAVVKPVLSFDLVYGFELLSDMVRKKGAYAGVNGGFYSQYGLPSGMVVIDGEIITPATGKFPVFILSDGKAEFAMIKSSIEIEYTKPDGAQGVFAADSLNTTGGDGQTVVYTDVYGEYNRSESKNISIVVIEGIVQKAATFEGKVQIPTNGMLVTFYPPFKFSIQGLPVQPGDKIELKHSPNFTKEDTQAYECGSWLVQNGASVAENKDPWVGVLTNKDPRTAIAIHKDGSVMLVTVDGRQPGYSEGLTGRELADYLISLGAKDAAFLDGGASTEMIVENTLVSRPSYKGQERPLAGGILVFRK